MSLFPKKGEYPFNIYTREELAVMEGRDISRTCTNCSANHNAPVQLTNHSTCVSRRRGFIKISVFEPVTI